MNARAVQLRAQFLNQFDANLRVCWVVTNYTRALEDLADDAERDLPNILFDRSLQPNGLASWHPVVGPDGSHWLFVDIPVRPWTDPRRDADRRATLPADLKGST